MHTILFTYLKQYLLFLQWNHFLTVTLMFLMYVEFQKNHICLGVNSFLRNFFKNVPRGLLVRLVNLPHW